MYLAVQTLSRKVHRSLTQRGIGGTIGRCVTKPLQVLAACARECLPEYRECRRHEAEFDREMKIDTAIDADCTWMARITSENWIHGQGYAPVPISIARALLDLLTVDLSKYVFIDYGAGKGRMLFLAAEYNFQRIIGVEYSEPLFEVLERNIQSYANPRRKCQSIEGVLLDAGKYDPPSEPLVLFFHHPFDEDVFQQVIQRIEASLERHPREVHVIYYDTICVDVFDRSKSFRCVQRGSQEGKLRRSWDWAIYSSMAGEPAELKPCHF